MGGNLTMRNSCVLSMRRVKTLREESMAAGQGVSNRGGISRFGLVPILPFLAFGVERKEKP